MLTVEEAAELLRCHPATIRRMIQRGDLAYVKVGRHYRIPDDAISARRVIVSVDRADD
jgi:excisionase family DNA binding protein